jgi:membrane protease YdiL (CAAX protease family)
MILSFFGVRKGNMEFLTVAVLIILRDIGLVGLVFFFLWRNGEDVLSIGWSGKRVGAELGIGLFLYAPLFFAASWLDGYLRQAGFSAPSVPLPAFADAKGLPEILLAFLMVVVVALAEETIFRGYILLRLRAIMPVRAAVVTSAVIFSLGHGYEGTAGVITVGFLGLVFAVIYLWRGSLIAPAVMHFLQDFGGIVLTPLLRHFNLF